MKKPLLNADCIKSFEKALEWELTHFYMYKLLANKCQMLGYFGAQDYFLMESGEEEEHYQKHVDFLNDEGVLAKLPILAPQKDSGISSLYKAIEMAYDNELELLEYYREMYKEEVMEYPEVATHLDFFLDTQREAVGFYGDIIAMFESEKDNPNICMVIDKKLKELTK
jgi:ferritin